eukprot:CAMPEP_0116984276 /NCGR_PEP_ID=MMETSP0467-20121206/61488_1 /TAXON_ID=283647 /ORGANISM="Mesodinium pulex, Strain SPMC105" /LENGTH=86 /DNA_ID=CAMNT_0004679221 /DNA_START=1161 /DNA_END=1421 /DNA_ORIENTATION=-
MIETWCKKNPTQICKINRHSGIAGHTVLHYKDKGKILTSSSHWIELNEFKVSDDKVYNEYKEMGGEMWDKFEEGLNNCQDDNQRQN